MKRLLTAYSSRRLAARCLVLGASLLVAGLVLPQPLLQPIELPVGSAQPSLIKGIDRLCLEAAPRAGATVVLRRCADVPRQRFLLPRWAEVGPVRLDAAGAEPLCLETPSEFGAPVTVALCDGGLAQRVHRTVEGRIVTGTGLCFDALTASSTLGVGACDDAPSQRWRPRLAGEIVLTGPVGPPLLLDIAFSRSDPRVVWAASDHILFRSDDSGRSWRAAGYSRSLPYDIVTLPDDPDTVLLLLYGELHASSSGLPLRAIGPEGGRYFSDLGHLAIDPVDPDTWYLTGRFEESSLYFRTHDRGRSWQRIALGPDDPPVIDVLAVDPGDPMHLVAVVAPECSSHGCAGRRGVWVSHDRGDQWTQLNDTVMLDGVLWIDPTNRKRLLGLWNRIVLRRSLDGGRTWSDVTPDGGLASYDVDVDGRLIASARDGRVLTSDDFGDTWRTAAPRLETGAFIAVDPTDTERWLLGDQDPIDPRGLFVVETEGEPQPVELPAPRSISQVATSGIGAGLASSRLDLYRTTDGGTSWRRVDVPLDTDVVNRIAALAFGPQRAAGGSVDPGERAYLAAESSSAFDPRVVVWRSEDRGATWRRLVELPGWRLDALVPSPHDPDLVLAFGGALSGDSGIWRSTDGGTNWRLVHPASSLPALPEFVPSRPGLVFASTFSDLLRSEDGGATWEIVGVGRSDIAVDSAGTVWAIRPTTRVLERDGDRGPWRAVGEIPAGSGSSGTIVHLVAHAIGGLVAAEEHDLYRSLDGGATWSRLSAGSITPRIGAVALDSFLGGLWAASQNGVLRALKADRPNLSLLGNRVQVEAVWRDEDGQEHPGVGATRSDLCGTFAFGVAPPDRPGDPDLLVKVIDGRFVNGHLWVFYASTTHRAFELTVTDRATGHVARDTHPAGTLASRGDVAALPDPFVGPPAREIALQKPPGSPNLLLHERFRARTTATVDGRTLDATRAPFTAGSGAFWLTDADNLEVLVKIVDGRTVNGHWWLFAGSASNRAFTLTVEDLQTGAVHTIENSEGSFLGHVDLDAFPG